jgi:hypothetical protein
MDAGYSEPKGRRSLGAAADSYLVAHGYNNHSLRLIAIEYDLAQESNEFAANLQKHGMPFCEAKYIYDLIESCDFLPDIF